MSNIYERIGEALLSNGQHDIIRAESKHEEDTLAKAGFTKVGSIKEGDKIVPLFKIEQKTKEVIKVVTAPTVTTPWNVPDNNYPWNNRPYINYFTSTGTGITDTYPSLYKGNITSSTDSAYNTLSDLENGFNMSVELYKLATHNYRTEQKL